MDEYFMKEPFADEFKPPGILHAEGGVYHMDTGLNDLDGEELPSRSNARRKFVGFLRSYRGSPDGGSSLGELKYRDALAEIPSPDELPVDMEDLIAHDAELATWLREEPTEAIPLIEQAAKDVVEGLRADDAENEGQITSDIQVMIKNTSEEPASVRSLGSEDVSRLVKVSGIVTAASRTKSKAKSLTLMCKSCRNVKSILCGTGLTSVSVRPASCVLPLTF